MKTYKPFRLRPPPALRKTTPASTSASPCKPGFYPLGTGNTPGSKENPVRTSRRRANRIDRQVRVIRRHDCHWELRFPLGESPQNLRPVQAKGVEGRPTPRTTNREQTMVKPRRDKSRSASHLYAMIPITETLVNAILVLRFAELSSEIITGLSREHTASMHSPFSISMFQRKSKILMVSKAQKMVRFGIGVLEVVSVNGLLRGRPGVGAARCRGGGEFRFRIHLRVARLSTDYITSLHRKHTACKHHSKLI
ncbi:hypothetical protein BHM03_00005277 [Ensete ventricosum]|nr:hypothetical protein BHM03_00005277 [Ensete ventricosum]